MVDANRGVVSLAAIQGPVGAPVTPDKTAYNPWPDDPRWNINAALQGSIPASTAAGFTLAQVTLPGDPPPPPAPTYWDVVAEAAQYGFVRIGDNFIHSSCVNR